MNTLTYNKETCKGCFYGCPFNLCDLPEKERHIIEKIFSHYITTCQDLETATDKIQMLIQKINDIKTALYD